MLPDVWKRHIQQERLKRDDLKLTRKLRSLRHLGSTKVQIGSHEFLNFSSNDYLGLTGDLRIAEAAASAAGRFGWGAAASRLVTGSSTLHSKLENEVAHFRGTEAALLFGSGYQANLGIISAMVGDGDTVFSDERNHASIVAGCRLSGAKVKVFKHRDHNDLERRMNNVKDGRVLVVTDSLFSVDGDAAELPPIVKLCERFGALLVVDDAHANAALGKSGKGVPEIQEVAKDVHVVVGTFSKALGSYGGFVACDEELRQYLVNHSRPFIYTTAMPIALAAANMEALKIIRREGDALRQKLATNTGFLRGKLENLDFELTGDFHIIGVKVGSAEEALLLANDVEFNGILVQPMRYPTVPKGGECLRISVTAAHTDEDLTRLVEALKSARDSVVQKKTDNVSRREAKRPTHQQLETAEMPAPEFDDMDEHPSSTGMSAVDSQRLPAADEVGDFDPEPVSAGDTMIMDPSGREHTRKLTDEDRIDQDEKETREIPPKNEDVRQTELEVNQPDAGQEAESKEAESKETPEPEDDPQPAGEASDEQALEDEDDELQPEPADEDDGPEATNDSGKTLAPEPSELPDPVIAEIESGGKKRKKKKKKKKRDKTEARKK